MKQQGFTMIEALIVVFIISAVLVGIFGLFSLNLRTASEAERRVIGIGLANQRAEQIRNLPYSQVGTSGGIPSGTIPQTQTVTSNNLTFTVKTDVRYVDDPFDGTAGGNPNDTLNTDYKLVRIEVSWTAPLKPNPIVLLMNVAPVGIEGGTTAGTLSFQALNAAGVGLPNVTVQLTNSGVAPAVNISTETDDSGRVVLPGLPPGSGYQLVASRSGYNTEQTYAEAGLFKPDDTHSQLTMIAGQVTSRTFYMDRVSTVNVYTKDTNGQSIANIGYTWQGTKSYAKNNEQPVYYVNTTQSTDATGKYVHTNLLWDSYSFTLTDTTYDIVESNLLLPLTVDPGTTQDLIVTLSSHLPLSLHMHVTSPDNHLIQGASVRLTGFGYDQTLVTGSPGQVFFGKTPSLSQAGTYTLNVSAPGYQSATQTVAIQGTTTMKVQLAATP